MCSREKNKDLKVADIYTACEVKACDCDKMQDATQLFQQAGEALPVFDYSHQYVGLLEPSGFVQFLDAYFENLKFGDRGNEFVMDNFEHDSEIHFLPIDQVSRYVNRELPTVSVDTSLAEAKQTILQAKANAVPVMDTDGNLVGTLSLRRIMEFEPPCRATTKLTSEFVSQS